MSVVFCSSARYRKVFKIFFALCCIFNNGFCTAAIASVDDFIKVNNIEVKRSAKNPISAKREALIEALRDAFCALLKDTFGISDNLTKITENEINECLYDYSVDNEKYSDLFYMASLSYRFDKSKVFSLLRKHNIEYSGAEDIKEIDAEKKIKVAIYTYDFIKNYNELKSIDYLVKRFSGEVVVLLIKSHLLCELKELDIKYAVI